MAQMKPNQETSYVKWTKEEMALLNHFMKIGLSKGLDQKTAAEFVSKKLGRSINSCLSMYHRTRDDYRSVPELEIQEPAEDVLPGKPLPKVKVYSSTGSVRYELKELDGILLLFVDDLIIRIE